MKCLDETRLVPGDIILTTANHYVSKAIRVATMSDISHAMIYVARCSVIDSTGEGVHARSTQRMFFDDDGAVHVRRLAGGLLDQQIRRIVAFARSRVGTRYSTREAMQSAAGKASKSPSKQQFCSRLVAQAYAWAGIRLVESPDYCTPNDIKSSPLLTAVADVLVSASAEQVARVRCDFDTNEPMRSATNKLLAAARTRCPDIESVGDIDAHLVANPTDDEHFVAIYEESGYLSAWEAEFSKNRWQYEFPLLLAMAGSRSEKHSYCIGVIEDHGEMLARREGNRAGYTILHTEYRLQTFARLRRLYEKLVDLQFSRRAVALQWMQKFAPDALDEPHDVGWLAPHTEEWFAILSKQNPQQAEFTRFFIEQGGSKEVCTFCGDAPALDHRYTGDDIVLATVITAKLCSDCRGIRRMQFNEEYSPL